MRRALGGGLAVLLAVAAALLLVQREQEPPRSRDRATPSRWREREVARAATRTAPPPSPASAAVAAPPKRDPLLAALPMKADSPVIVFEMNALRHSPVGERILACVQGQNQNHFAEIARKSGIDPLKDIDRVAYLGDATVVSGQFDQARWNQLGSAGEAYGDGGRVYKTPQGAVGAWRDQIAVVSSSPEEVRTAIDQLEGRAPVPQMALPDELSYAEIYGVVPGAAARRLFGGDNAEGGLTGRLASLASRIELHVDAMQDLAVKVRVRGEDPAGLADLAKGLGTALTAARATAQATGNKGLSALLEKAAVRPGDRELSIELAVPAARIDEVFSDCRIFGMPAAPVVSNPGPRSQADDVGGPT